MNSTAFDLNTDALVSSSHLVTFKDLHYALLTNDLPHRQFLKSEVPADKILTESFSMTTSTLEVSSTERICNYLRGMYDRYLTVTLAEFGLEKILEDLTSAKAQNNYTRFKEEYHDLNIDLIRCFTQIVTSIQQRDVIVFNYQDEEYKTHEVTLTRTLPGYGQSYERVGCYLVTADNYLSDYEEVKTPKVNITDQSDRIDLNAEISTHLAANSYRYRATLFRDVGWFGGSDFGYRVYNTLLSTDVGTLEYWFNTLRDNQLFGGFDGLDLGHRERALLLGISRSAYSNIYHEIHDTHCEMGELPHYRYGMLNELYRRGITEGELLNVFYLTDNELEKVKNFSERSTWEYRLFPSGLKSCTPVVDVRNLNPDLAWIYQIEDVALVSPNDYHNYLVEHELFAHTSTRWNHRERAAFLGLSIDEYRSVYERIWNISCEMDEFTSEGLEILAKASVVMNLSGVELQKMFVLTDDELDNVLSIKVNALLLKDVIAVIGKDKPDTTHELSTWYRRGIEYLIRNYHADLDTCEMVLGGCKATMQKHYNNYMACNF